MFDINLTQVNDVQFFISFMRYISPIAVSVMVWGNLTELGSGREHSWAVSRELCVVNILTSSSLTQGWFILYTGLWQIEPYISSYNYYINKSASNVYFTDILRRTQEYFAWTMEGSIMVGRNWIVPGGSPDHQHWTLYIINWAYHNKSVDEIFLSTA